MDSSERRFCEVCACFIRLELSEAVEAFGCVVLVVDKFVALEPASCFFECPKRAFEEDRLNLVHLQSRKKVIAFRDDTSFRLLEVFGGVVGLRTPLLQGEVRLLLR